LVSIKGGTFRVPNKTTTLFLSNNNKSNLDTTLIQCGFVLIVSGKYPL